MIEDIAAFHSRQKHESFGPQFRRGLSLADSSVGVDETLTVQASYENLGATQAATTATVLVDGEAQVTREIEVSAGDSTTFEADLSFAAAGEYTVSLDETTAESVEVTVADTSAASETPAETTDTDGAEQSKTTGTEQPGFGIGQTIAALGGIGYLIKRHISGNT
jgi:hypothetical protein